MGNTTSNSFKVKESVQNSFLTVNDNTCTASDNVNQTGNTVNASDISGNATVFSVSGSMSASCSVNQQIVQSSTAILAAQAGQTAKVESDFFNDGIIYSGSKNSANIQQSIVNNSTSITSNTCNSNVSVTQTSNTVNMSGVGGNFTAFDISADSNSVCTLNNTVNQESYNTQQANVDQSAVNIGMMVAIVSSFVALAIIGLIALIIIFGLGGAGYMMLGGKKASTTQQQAPPPQYQGGYGNDYGGGYGDEY